MASKARRRPLTAPPLTASQTEALLAMELMREGMAKLEYLHKDDQVQALTWGRAVYPQEEGVWKALETWLED
jgi:predicted urease superfamily metal-dependent hydrolase